MQVVQIMTKSVGCCEASDSLEHAALARNATCESPFDEPGLRANVTDTLAAICAPPEQPLEL
jgi:hypothetical protein